MGVQTRSQGAAALVQPQRAQLRPLVTAVVAAAPSSSSEAAARVVEVVELGNFAGGAAGMAEKVSIG